MGGKFIVFEGIDGCGKGTQLKMLATYLFDKQKRNNILLTREPTGISPAGQELRKRLAEDKNPKENAELYAKLFIEDRKHHIKTMIVPALDAGITVLCDRYKYSTIVYQTLQGMSTQKLIDMHKDMPVPDIVFMFDVPAKIALGRMRRSKEVFENEETLEELRNGYLKIKEHLQNENIKILNGTPSIGDIHKIIVQEVEMLSHSKVHK